MSRTAPLTRRTGAAAGALLLAASLAATTGPADAAVRHHSHASEPVVVATGLANPRQLTVSDGALYVAEAGSGGPALADGSNCVTGPEGDVVCLGATGAVTKVTRWGQERVLEGLPSVAGADGSASTGPSDVAVDGRRFAVLVGLGADPAARAALPAPGQRLGTLLGGTFRGRGHGYGHDRHAGARGPRVLADVSAYESTANPDGAQIDSNPVGLWAGRRGWVVADAGANAVLGVSARSGISTLGVLPTRLVDPPPFLPPGQIPMDAVPTSAVPGPDGALYVSQLTGFPFPVGGANIYRLVPGQAPTLYASGLTNVTDLGWYGGRLYAVQLADEGLLGTPEGQLPSGSLLRIGPDGTHEVVADDLVAPYGLALSRGSAYVTTCSVCPDSGEVLRVPLG